MPGYEMTSAGASGESPDLAVLGDGMSYPELPVKLPAWGQRSIGVKGGGGGVLRLWLPAPHCQD